MSMRHDPELDDILQDGELQHVADLLRAGRMTEEPPLDDAFRSALRRQLMNRAWGMGGPATVPWWRKAFGPAGLAWAGAAVGVLLIAAAVVFTALTSSSTGGLTQEVQVSSPMNQQSAVRLQQPILVTFNQPMDHPSTEGAVQITPATTVAFSWSANTLSVQPTSGNLAPNTQYQVTIGPGAKTASGEKLTAPKTITFVTQPPAPTPSPTPTPIPSPTPRAQLPDQHQVLSVTAAVSNPQWSSDSSIVFFVTAGGALISVPAAGGAVTTLVPDGVLSAAIAPAGDRLAYIRDGKIEVLGLVEGLDKVEISPFPAPTRVGWTKDGVVWAAIDGVYAQGPTGPTKLTSLPTTSNVLSFSPDGAHLAYTQDQSLYVFDVGSGKGIVLGLAGAQFLGWSPDGTGLMYSTAQGVVVSDVGGKIAATLPAGEPNWSSQDEILLGSDTDLWEVRPDGTGLTKLAEGTYHFPVWAPNGTAFVYVRGGGIFGATAPAGPPRPSVLDAATSAVNSFMQARKSSDSVKANSYLDDNGRRAYSSSGGGLNLVVAGDPSFSRYYLLTQSITGDHPDTTQFVVRIVLSHEKLDVSTYEETLTLVRTQGSQQFLIDQATAGPLLTLGKGAEVVSVEVSASSVKITFDSDLKPESVAAGVIILDSKGKQVGANPVYANRTVTISGLDLKPHATYKLVVLSTVQDVGGTNIAAEYDLMFTGPAEVKGSANKRGEQSPSPSPIASPSATPSSASPSPSS